LLQPLLLLQLLQPLLVRPAAAEPVPGRPALAPWYRQVAHDDRLLLEHAGTLVTLEGRAATALMPALLALLDGTRTVEELVTALGRAAEPAIANALDVLGRLGLLVDGDSVTTDDPGSPGAADAALFAAALRRTSPGKAREALAGARVSIAGSGPASREVAQLLDDAGVGDVRAVPLEVAQSGEDLVVATPGRDELDRLVSLNGRLLRAPTPWLQLLPTDGRLVVIGPLFLPGHSACHSCYQLRRAACSNYEADFQTVATAPARAPFPRALIAAAAGLAATLAIRWLATRDPALPGRFYALETGAVLALSCHHVLRVPRCPACSPPDRAMPAPWYRETADADPAR
jgi:bacteriocin biosynthesis cyclodehydratase domain-containing protein